MRVFKSLRSNKDSRRWLGGLLFVGAAMTHSFSPLGAVEVATPEQTASISRNQRYENHLAFDFGRSISSTTTTDNSKTRIIAQAETASAGTVRLEGKAELTEMDDATALRVQRDYEKGFLFLKAAKYGQAAELFKRAGAQCDRGYEKYRAEALYAEAQCRRMIGQKALAANCYQSAIKLFQEHVPDSPYLKASIEQLGNIELKMQVARLDAPRKLVGAINVDRNVTLQGRIGEDGVRLSGRKALLEVEEKFIKDSLHECFIEMTCLETAELGSNSTNAQNRWLPLMAYGQSAAVLASDDYFTPLIKVKINGKKYNINVDLPDLASHQRTVLLLTDGEKICAIDPGTNDVWLLKMKFKPDGKASFSFKKLLHQKAHIKKR